MFDTWCKRQSCLVQRILNLDAPCPVAFLLLLSAAAVKTEPGAGTAVTCGPSPPVAAPAPSSVHVASAATTVKQEQGADTLAHDLIK